MKTYIKSYLKFTGILIGVAIVLGMIIGVVSYVTLLQGVYISLFGAGALCLLYASFMFVGTPRRRFEYYTKQEYKSDSVRRSDGRAFESFGILPALAGITAIVLGFVLEAWNRII